MAGSVPGHRRVARRRHRAHPGDSGTGKELVARAIYNSARSAAPFLAIKLRRNPREPPHSRFSTKGRIHGAPRVASEFEPCAGPRCSSTRSATFAPGGGGHPGAPGKSSCGSVRSDLRTRRRYETFVTPMSASIASTHRDLRHAAPGGRGPPDLYYRLRRIYHSASSPARTDGIPSSSRGCTPYSGSIGSSAATHTIAPEELEAWHHDWP